MINSLYRRCSNPFWKVGLLATAVGVLIGGGAWGQDDSADNTDRFEARTFEADSGELKYRLLRPLGAAEGEKFPLVVFLHGAGERGDDNAAQLKHVVQELATDTMQARYPAFVIAPQCPRDGWWAGRRPRRLGPDSPPSVSLMLQLVDQLQSEFPIDPDRIYITGLSMGGYGTWGAILERPDLFAAAAPMCGAGDPEQVSKVVNLPIWIFHGDEDRAVPVERSREMVAALKAAGGNPIYTEYPGVGHDCWTQTAQNRLFWDWLFAQKRSAKSANE